MTVMRGVQPIGSTASAAPPPEAEAPPPQPSPEEAAAFDAALRGNGGAAPAPLPPPPGLNPLPATGEGAPAPSAAAPVGGGVAPQDGSLLLAQPPAAYVAGGPEVAAPSRAQTGVPEAQPIPTAPTVGDALPKLNDPNTIAIGVDAYIPAAEVTAPLPGDQRFAGDNRGPNDPNGTFRFMQAIQITTDPTGANQPQVSVQALPGVTHRTSDNVYATPDIGDVEMVGEPVFSNNDQTVTIQVQARASDPLAATGIPLIGGIVQYGTPNIDYDLTITATNLGNGQWDVQVSGSHDAFPAYEVVATSGGKPQQAVYSYDPTGTGASLSDLWRGDGPILPTGRTPVLGFPLPFGEVRAGDTIAQPGIEVDANRKI